MGASRSRNLRGRLPAAEQGPSRRSLAALLAILAACPLAALDWPLDPARVAATFGTMAAGRIVTGLALAAEGGLVRPIAEGEIVFAVSEGIGPGGLPSALGAFVVVEHAAQIAAVYSHLAPGTTPAEAKTVLQGEFIGATGRSGWAEGEGMLLQAYDRKEARWVNPLLLLPPLADAKAPIIRGLALVGEGRSLALGTSSTLRQGTYALALDAVDPADSAWAAGALAPYSMRLSVDGSLVAACVFDVARASSGELLFFSEPPRSASILRGPEGRYHLADRFFTRGRAVVEAVVEDAAGNRRSATWSVAVE